MFLRAILQWVWATINTGMFGLSWEIFWIKSGPHGVLVSEGCYNKVPQIMWLKQKKFIVPWLWRPKEAQNTGKDLFALAPWLVDVYLLLVSLHVIFPLCVPLCLNYAPPPFLRASVILD